MSPARPDGSQRSVSARFHKAFAQSTAFFPRQGTFPPQRRGFVSRSPPSRCLSDARAGARNMFVATDRLPATAPCRRRCNGSQLVEPHLRLWKTALTAPTWAACIVGRRCFGNNQLDVAVSFFGGDNHHGIWLILAWSNANGCMG